MIRKMSCTAAVCLLLVGCSGLGGSPRGADEGVKLIPGRLGSPPSKDSFAEAVANDPFPGADQGEVRQ